MPAYTFDATFAVTLCVQAPDEEVARAAVRDVMSPEAVHPIKVGGLPYEVHIAAGEQDGDAALLYVDSVLV